jgi:hypothetical protein
MRSRRLAVGAAFAAALMAVPFQVAGAQADDANELSRKATDPTASLMAFNVNADYTGGYYGNLPGSDDSWSLQFRPVIPFKAFGVSNILRLTLPYGLSGRDDDGLGDVTLFDLVVINESWGRWGVGPVMSFAADDDAADDFVFGPAIGGVWQYTGKLYLGIFNQNVFGSDTALSQLQPVISYQLGNGWSLSAGDLQFAYDWKDDRWLSIPVGFQVGKVTRIAGQAVRFAVNPQYNLADDDGFPKWKVTLAFALLVPGM